MADTGHTKISRALVEEPRFLVGCIFHRPLARSRKYCLHLHSEILVPAKTSALLRHPKLSFTSTCTLILTFVKYEYIFESLVHGAIRFFSMTPLCPGTTEADKISIKNCQKALVVEVMANSFVVCLENVIRYIVEHVH